MLWYQLNNRSGLHCEHMKFLLYWTEKTVTHIASLLTSGAVVVGTASDFASGSGLDGRGSLGLGNGGSTSCILVRGSTGRNKAVSLLCRTKKKWSHETDIVSLL